MSAKEDEQPPDTDHDPESDADDHRGPGVSVLPGSEHRDQVVVDPHPLVVTGIAADEDDGPESQEEGPAERAQKSQMKSGRHDLDHNQEGDDGGDQPNAPAVGHRPGEDAGGLSLEGDEQPGQDIGQDPGPAGQGEQDEGDPDQGDVDTGGGRQPAAHTGDHPGVRAAAETTPPVTVGPERAPGLGEARWEVPTSRATSRATDGPDRSRRAQGAEEGPAGRAPGWGNRWTWR